MTETDMPLAVVSSCCRAKTKTKWELAPARKWYDEVDYCTKCEKQCDIEFVRTDGRAKGEPWGDPKFTL